MKKILSAFLSLLLIFMCIPMRISAAVTIEEHDGTIQFQDGSYITIEIHSSPTRATSTKTGSKVYTYYNSNDVAEWKATLTGTFSYDGTTSSCKSASCDVTIVNNNWYEITNKVTTSGASAIANLTVGLKLLGIKINEKSVQMTLTCDKNGKLS